MDLTLSVGDTTLNIRVAVLVRTKNGIILEKNKLGYYFLVGGRIKVNESSEQAVRREVMEEIGIDIREMRLKAVIENFFNQESHGNRPVHEICFIYSIDEIPELNLGADFLEVKPSDIDSLDLRPKIMKEVIESVNDEVLHIVYKA